MEYIDLLYLNVLDRNADNAGLLYWVDQLQDGMARGEVLARFSDSIENVQNTEVMLSSLHYAGHGEWLFVKKPMPLKASCHAGSPILNPAAGTTAAGAGALHPQSHTQTAGTGGCPLRRCGLWPPIEIADSGRLGGGRCGARHQQNALSGRLVERLSEHHEVHWQLNATTGHKTRDAIQGLARLTPYPVDVALISLGLTM